jgi:hypothetical protein
MATIHAMAWAGMQCHSAMLHVGPAGGSHGISMPKLARAGVAMFLNYYKKCVCMCVLQKEAGEEGKITKLK